MDNDGGAAPIVLSWVICIIEDGVSLPSTISQTSTNSVYQPEQNVLAFGCGRPNDAIGNINVKFGGATKTQRKLKVGDKLYFSAISSAATGGLAAMVQFFLKA